MTGPACAQSERPAPARSGKIANQSVVGDLEDRRLCVLVDRNDDLRVLHPREVLDRARDADCEIHLRRDDLAGLANLVIVGT